MIENDLEVPEDVRAEENLAHDEPMAAVDDPEVTTVDRDPAVEVEDLEGDEDAYPNEQDSRADRDEYAYAE